MMQIKNKFYNRLFNGRILVKKIPKKEYKDFIDFATYAYDFGEKLIDDFYNTIYLQIYLTNLTADDFYKVLRDKRKHSFAKSYNEKILIEINNIFKDYSKYKLKKDLELTLTAKHTNNKKVKI